MIAAWDSRRQEAGSYGVYARSIDSGGRLSARAERLNVLTEGDQVRPAAAWGSAGDPWFAWSSFGPDGRMGAVVGRGTGDEHALAGETEPDGRSVVAAELAGGRRVVAWSTSGRTAPSQIVYRLFDRGLAPIGPERFASPNGDAADALPAVAAAGAGGFVLAWAHPARKRDRRRRRLAPTRSGDRIRPQGPPP